MEFFASIKPVGNTGLFHVEPIGAVDPGFGNRPPIDPGYGRPGWTPADPGYGRPEIGWGHPDHGLPSGGYPSHGLPGSPGHPSHPIVIPNPPEVQPPPTKPIVIPKPSLPAGSGVVVPFPADATVPTPTTPPAPGSEPYILWYGPGSVSSVVYLPPAQVAAPK